MPGDYGRGNGDERSRSRRREDEECRSVGRVLAVAGPISWHVGPH